jgi:hypothetical protein
MLAGFGELVFFYQAGDPAVEVKLELTWYDRAGYLT